MEERVEGGDRILRGRLAIVAAAAAWSTAGVGQRELGVSPATQVAGRALFAALALVLLVLSTERRGTVAAFRRLGWIELGGVVVTVAVVVQATAGPGRSTGELRVSPS